ncbi:Gfo/Idh/MocA family protein [Microbacterium aurantiacum]|uniref:Gfo/Idh/MocA family protein n=1 Tax=Microbacterium aurantiacum TaxID=162393 RepID=UPI000C80D1C5|nr:Gfo/Idh/MocA family oxidoreductase [Microbacterium aurantiacum]
MTAVVPTRLVIIGAGSRGTGYARRAVAEGAMITAVVEPDAARLRAFLAEFSEQPVIAHDTWQQIAAQPTRIADAVVVSTPDRLHAEPAIGLARAGYHLLLEKPMAPTEEESTRIVAAAEDAGVMLAVCHVMRYSSYSQTLKKLLDEGTIGRLVSVEHLEPIGWWHFAHSYVRGNWAREEDSGPMLLTKSSHDIDWLSYIVGLPVERVSSFGSLLHFRPESKPANATARCLDCPLQNTCAYSATKIYRGFLGDATFERWPLAVLTTDVTASGVDRALRDGPYGRCVFDGQNDVVDHQVVNIEYQGGVTASFTVTAFTELDFRKTRLFGTAGSIEGDGRTLIVHEFSTDHKYEVFPESYGNASAADGHGGADDALVRAFLHAVRTGDRSVLLSGPEESLTTHRVVWLAEQARRDNVVMSVAQAASAL